MLFSVLIYIRRVDEDWLCCGGLHQLDFFIEVSMPPIVPALALAFKFLRRD